MNGLITQCASAITECMNNTSDNNIHLLFCYKRLDASHRAQLVTADHQRLAADTAIHTQSGTTSHHVNIVLVLIAT